MVRILAEVSALPLRAGLDQRANSATIRGLEFLCCAYGRGSRFLLACDGTAKGHALIRTVFLKPHYSLASFVPALWCCNRLAFHCWSQFIGSDELRCDVCWNSLQLI